MPKACTLPVFRVLILVLLFAGLPAANAQQSATSPDNKPDQNHQDQDQDQSAATLKVNVNVVQLFFNVKDKRGALIPNLTKNDFQILEDGKPQTIKYFAAESNLPLTLGILIDSSGSQARVLDMEKQVGGEFLSQILRDKVKQMQRSGATWLRIDLMDGLWQFSAWSQSPLGPKTEAMSGAVRAALGGLSGIRGVVMSSSCATTMSRLTGQSTLVDGTYGLVRDLGNFKGRETLVIPLVEDAEAEALAWVHLYDSEPSWLDTALGELGHPPMSELGAVQNIVG